MSSVFPFRSKACRWRAEPVAPGEEAVNQPGHRPGVVPVEVGSQVVEQFVVGLTGRSGRGVGRVDQVAGEPEAGGPPVGRSEQIRPQWPVVVALLAAPLDRGPGQDGDQHHVGHRGHDVGNPDRAAVGPRRWTITDPYPNSVPPLDKWDIGGAATAPTGRAHDARGGSPPSRPAVSLTPWWVPARHAIPGSPGSRPGRVFTSAYPVVWGGDPSGGGRCEALGSGSRVRSP